MKVLVIGAGLVGSPSAERLRELGHEVTVTTTTAAKVEPARRALRRRDRAARHATATRVHAAIAAADAVVVTAGPSAQRVDDARGARQDLPRDPRGDRGDRRGGAGRRRTWCALSSLSVYGNAANHLDVVTEDAPTTDSDRPEPDRLPA